MRHMSKEDIFDILISLALMPLFIFLMHGVAEKLQIWHMWM